MGRTREGKGTVCVHLPDKGKGRSASTSLTRDAGEIQVLPANVLQGNQ
jgi:hypothetical protein